MEKNKIGKKDKRRKEIISILSKNTLMSVVQLAKVMNVSTETIRQDLRSEFLMDKVIQVHGSVTLAETTAPKDVPFCFRQGINSKTKHKIAEEACSFIMPGQVVVMEHSTIAFIIVQILSKNKILAESITIITNSFSIVNYIFENNLDMKVIFLGGVYSKSQNNTYGVTTINQMNGLHGDISFMSPAAIDERLLITAYKEKDVALQKCIFDNCKKNVLLIEKSKYSKVAMYSVNYGYEYDNIITDVEFSEENSNTIKSNAEMVFIGE